MLKCREKYLPFTTVQWMAQVDELLKNAPIFIVKSDDVTNVKHVILFGFCGYFSISYFVYHAVGATHFCRLTPSDIDRLGLNFAFRFISFVRSSVSLTSWVQSLPVTLIC